MTADDPATRHARMQPILAAMREGTIKVPAADTTELIEEATRDPDPVTIHVGSPCQTRVDPAYGLAAALVPCTFMGWKVGAGGEVLAVVRFDLGDEDRPFTHPNTPTAILRGDVIVSPRSLLTTGGFPIKVPAPESLTASGGSIGASIEPGMLGRHHAPRPTDRADAVAFDHYQSIVRPVDLPGLVTHPPISPGGDRLWASKTADEIIADVAALIEHTRQPLGHYRTPRKRIVTVAIAFGDHGLPMLEGGGELADTVRRTVLDTLPTMPAPAWTPGNLAALTRALAVSCGAKVIDVDADMLGPGEVVITVRIVDPLGEQLARETSLDTATGRFLDNLAAMFGVTRRPGEPDTVIRTRAQAIRHRQFPERELSIGYVGRDGTQIPLGPPVSGEFFSVPAPGKFHHAAAVPPSPIAAIVGVIDRALRESFAEQGIPASLVFDERRPPAPERARRWSYAKPLIAVDLTFTPPEGQGPDDIADEIDAIFRCLLTEIRNGWQSARGEGLDEDHTLGRLERVAEEAIAGFGFPVPVNFHKGAGPAGLEITAKLKIDFIERHARRDRILASGRTLGKTAMRAALAVSEFSAAVADSAILYREDPQLITLADQVRLRLGKPPACPHHTATLDPAQVDQVVRDGVTVRLCCQCRHPL